MEQFDTIYLNDILIYSLSRYTHAMLSQFTVVSGALSIDQIF